MLTGWKDITHSTGLSENTLRKLIREEDFPVQYLGRTPVVTMDQVLAWLDKRLQNGTAKRCQ